MKKTLLAMTAVCALAAAAPAAAQYANANAGGTVGFANRIAMLEGRLDTDIQTGAVSRIEAVTLQRRLSDIRNREALYARGGFTVAERTDLQQRLRAFREELRVADNGRWGNAYGYDDERYGSNAYVGTRYDRYGRVDPNGMYDRAGNRIDVDQRYGSNAYVGTRYDRYGRVDPNGMYDRAGNRIDVDQRYGSNAYVGTRYDRYGRVDPNGMYDRAGNRIDVDQRYGSNAYVGTRYDRYGRVDPNGMYDRAGNRIDVNSQYGSQAYVGTRYDRYGRVDPNGMYDREGNRIDTGYRGQGGPYGDVDDDDLDDARVVCERRPGVTGVIDTMLGRSNCYTVGSRVDSNLGAVPYEYRNTYRDGGGYYYRSDGRRIYRIDARTNTVVEIFPM